MRAAERGLIGVDDGVGVQRVELARTGTRTAVPVGASGISIGSGLLLVAVVAHGSPPVGEVVGGLAVLAGEHAGRRIPPADGPIGGGEGGQQRPVDPGASGASSPPRVPSNGSGEAKVKCENAPWIRVSDLIGLAAPVSPAGRPASA